MSPQNANHVPSTDEIQIWLVRHLAELLGVDPQEIEVDQPLSVYGLSSREELTLAGDLEDWLDVELPSTVIWDHPTIAALSGHLGEPAAVAAVA